jgi:cell division protein FtsQ
MPAVVRGGRRQASKPEAAPKASQGRGAPKGRGAARKGASPGGKRAIIGSVPIPNEVTGWFAVIMVVTLLTVVLMTGGRATALGQGITRFADGRLAAMGISLQHVRLEGVSDAAAPDIQRVLDMKRGDPLALMDLAAVQKSVESVGWVRQASVRRQLPGLLVITIVERPRLAVWQYKGKSMVVDDQGQIIPEARAPNFLNLPLVVGEGANEQAAAILELMNARPGLMQKTYALVRVDTRRWDIHLKNGTIVKLPALNQDDAMARLDALITERRVLDQGFAEIDLLDPTALQVVPLVSRPTPQT